MPQNETNRQLLQKPPNLDGLNNLNLPNTNYSREMKERKRKWEKKSELVGNVEEKQGRRKRKERECPPSNMKSL